MEKKAYRRIIEDHLSKNNPWRMWQGIQHITNYKGKGNSIVNADNPLAEELNCFFAHFEVNRPTPVTLPPPASDTHTHMTRT